MEAADSDKLASAAQMVRRVGVLSCDFGYNKILASLDSTKMVMGMLMDAFQPFLGQYSQVRCSLFACMRSKQIVSLFDFRSTPFPWLDAD